jgi:uncharacterized protein YegP (UPF0339 family)
MINEQETTAVAGTFQIIQEEEGAFLFRLTAGDGTVVAVSPRFTPIKGAVDGIAAVRENAAAGLVVNRSSCAPAIPREEHAGPGRTMVMAA